MIWQNKLFLNRAINSRMIDFLTSDDWAALGLTLKLAGFTTLILLVIGTPLAWWLSKSRSKIKVVAESLTALPLVLPPTVLGFYLLLLLGPNGFIGQSSIWLTGSHLAFTFAGLVIGSVIYSLPFTVQPLQNSFVAMGKQPLEVASTLGISPIKQFFLVVLPGSSRGYFSAAVLTFAHTMGEFGVVLMIGGNLPDKTRVVSIAIYEQVESLQYVQAHRLALVLMLLSFTLLLLMYFSNQMRANKS